MLKKAVHGFDEVMKADFSDQGDFMIDILNNARVQKFEIATELLWKTLQELLNWKDGIIVRSPKRAVKEFYLNQYCAEEQYEILYNAIESRNLLSHVYRDAIFEDILEALPGYLQEFKSTIEKLDGSTSK